MNLTPEQQDEIDRRRKSEREEFLADPSNYQTIRGVTLPIEPGSSSLRIEIDRKKALKRMKKDDRILKRLGGHR